MEEWIEIIKQLGFPVAVAAFLIWDRVKLMNRFIEVMDKVAERSTAHTKAVNKLTSLIRYKIDGEIK